MTQLEKMLNGYLLTTAEITYRMPDHPSLLQKYIWQELDMAPGYPVLTRFLDFWERKLDGALHRVQVAHKGLISPVELRYLGGELTLH